MTLPVAFFTKSNTALVQLDSKVKRVFEDKATNNALHNNSSESVSNVVIEIDNNVASVNRTIHSMIYGPLKDVDDKII